MAFRKRNIALSRTGSETQPPTAPTSPNSIQAPHGVRPSPIDGRPTTSTGIPSLDAILAGHAGLPLGNSLVIGESGTTDYAGALLRFYAAEGVVQGHRVHVVGMGEVWGRELPGLVVGKEDERKEKGEKMKIAWRYEGLGQHESGRGALRQSVAILQSWFNSGSVLMCDVQGQQRTEHSRIALGRRSKLSSATHSILRNVLRCPSERQSIIYQFHEQPNPRLFYPSSKTYNTNSLLRHKTRSTASSSHPSSRQCYILHLPRSQPQSSNSSTPSERSYANTPPA